MTSCVRCLDRRQQLAIQGVLGYRLYAMHATPKRLNTQGSDTEVAPNA
jgi:hypothetical protein